TARHADVILPGVSPLEDSHYDVPFPMFSHRNHARYSAPVLPLAAGQVPEWQTMLRLIAILRGLGANADIDALDDEMVAEDVRKQAGPHADAVIAALAGRRGPDRLLDLSLRSGPYGDGFGTRPGGLTLDKVQAAPSGIDLGPLQPRIPEMLRTPSGKAELAPTMLIADVGRAAAQLAQPADDIVIVGRRHVRSNNSWMHNLPLLAKGPNRCTALVHPQDAQRLGLSHGGRAQIRGRAGHEIEAEVEVSDEMTPGAISVPNRWGHA